VWTDGETDRYNEANNCFSKFCEHAKKWSKICEKGTAVAGLSQSQQETETYFYVPSHSSPIGAGSTREVDR
jgi:hypothetical protein